MRLIERFIKGHILLPGGFFFPPIPSHPRKNGNEHRHVVRAPEITVFQRPATDGRTPGKRYIKNADLATNLSTQ